MRWIVIWFYNQIAVFFSKPIGVRMNMKKANVKLKKY